MVAEFRAYSDPSKQELCARSRRPVKPERLEALGADREGHEIADLFLERSTVLHCAQLRAFDWHTGCTRKD